MSTQTISLTDSIYIRRSPSHDRIRSDEPPRHFLIYFIPGNPGLIQYYEDFLTHLVSLLEPDLTNHVYHVVGHSLGGFEVEQDIGGALQLKAHLTGNPAKVRTGGTSNWGLNRQEFMVYESLRKTVEQLIEDGTKEVARVRVMVVGHSVGAYLMMQTVQWRQFYQGSRQKLDKVTGIDSFESLSREEHLDDVNMGIDTRFQIIGGAGLFPTIVDLAGSPKGRTLAPFAKQWWFAHVIQFLAFSLQLIPAVIVQLLVKYLLRQPRQAANVTAAFLRSRCGVYQALFMAGDELREITTDTWHDNVWDRRSKAVDEIDRPQLYLFWGDNDHWVKNSARDKIIHDHARLTGKSVADELGRPYMEVDRTGIPHDFCIQLEHSKRVAEKVSEFVGNVLTNS